MTSEGYKIPFLEMTGGKICVAGEGLQFRSARSLLENHGDIYSLDLAERESRKAIVCEYYDRRGAIDAVENINGREMFVLHPSFGTLLD